MTQAQLLQAAEAATGIGGWVFDGAAGCMQFTPQAVRLLGLAPGLQPMPWTDVLAGMLAGAPQDECLALQAAIDAALASGAGACCNTTLELASAQPRHLCWTIPPVPPPAAVHAHVLGTLHALPGTRAALALDPRTFEFAVAAAGVGLFEVDLSGGAATWSDLTLRIYGLPPASPAPSREQWRSRHLHADDRTQVDAAVEAFLAGDASYALDYRIRRAGDGAVRWLHTRCARLEGEPHRVLGMTLDITERKLAEQQAHEAWHALDLSATQVGFGFGWRDVDSDAGVWSPQLKRMFGLLPTAPTPTRAAMQALLDAADRERMRLQMQLPPTPGEVRTFEYGLRRPDGRRRSLMTRAVVGAAVAGRPLRYDFVVVDVTEIRARDQHLAGLLERLRRATEACGVGTWEHDPQQPGVGWDNTTLALFGLPPDGPAPDAERYLAIVHPDDRAHVTARLQASLAGRPDGADDAGRHAFEFEFRVQLPGDRFRWLVTRGRSEFGADGRFLRQRGICLDITTRREAEAALLAKEVAERANAAKTAFLSRMSHELRTPLNAVLGFAQLLALDPRQSLTEMQRGQLSHIQSAGWHLLALINDVLDLTRIEARQAPMARESVPVAELLRECLLLTAAAADERGIALQAPPPAELAGVAVWGDRARCRQVLLQLLSNAVKYNRDAGWVRLEVGAQPKAEEAAAGHKAVVQIRVHDGGLGLTPTQLAQLFEPFSRLGQEHSAVEGTGIGLTLSRLIAQQMSGRLVALSEAGAGSVFTFSLPAAD